jgi:hypothetical protein
MPVEDVESLGRSNATSPVLMETPRISAHAEAIDRTDVAPAPLPQASQDASMDLAESAALPNHNESAAPIIQSGYAMFKLLHFHSEQSSSGMVDKVLIDQTSFQSLCSTLEPGSFTSATKVDFKALDQHKMLLSGMCVAFCFRGIILDA